MIEFADDEDTGVLITCTQDSECNEPGVEQSYAHTFWDGEKGYMNLCDPWFENDIFPSTSEMEGYCGDFERTVEEFETPAATLLHKFLHLGVCEDIQAPFPKKEVYGGAKCAQLAKEIEDKALRNPDNWMLVTIGTYWDKKCNRRIKLGVPGADNGPFVSTTGPDPTTPPYEPGICSLKLTQTATTPDLEDGKYTLDAQVFDSKGNPNGNDKVVASNDSPLKLMSKLENIMQLRPSKEHNSMVYFRIGAQTWDTTMNDDKHVPYCKRSTDTLTTDLLVNKVYDDCKFHCTWDGGKSSDGSN